MLRSRMLQEAKALARLANANVVTVYEVGTASGELFIAMEYINGCTLSDWLAESKRSWSDIIDKFIDAGRGLAAAHAAGIVHRDFKPDNVLVGNDGRVCVTDFGLARSEEDRAEALAKDARSALVTKKSPRRRKARLTQSGLLMGTPTYMSPEQHRGEVVDARSDGFSFCVALYQALYDQNPFDGEALGELFESVTSGQLKPPPKDSRVPARVRTALIRELSVDPAERFESMDALLAQLRQPIRRRDWRAWAALGVIGVGAVGALAFAMPQEAKSEPPCSGSAEQYASVWNDGRTATVKAAFSATGASFQSQAFDAADGALRDLGTRWAAMHKDACEATHVRKDQSTALLDLRMQCLERVRQQAAAVVSELERADRDTVAHAAASVFGVDDPQACADINALSETRQPPTDPDSRAEYERLRARFVEISANHDLGRWADSAKPARDLVAAAVQLGYHPFTAEARLLLGKLQWRLGKLPEARTSLELAAASAEAGRFTQVKVRAWIELVLVVGYEMGQYRPAGTWYELAKAGLENVPDNELLRARLMSNRGASHFVAGQRQRAYEAHKESVALARRSLGDDHLLLGEFLSRLGSTCLDRGLLEQAEQYSSRGLELRRRILGAEHPDVAESLNNVANVHVAREQLDKAEELYLQAKGMWERALGADHPRVAVALTNLAGLAARRGDLDAGLKLLLQALDIESAAFSPNHPAVAATHNNLGTLYAASGDTARAATFYKKALAYQIESTGPVSPAAATVQTALAAALLDSRDFTRALALARQAKDTWQQLGGAPASRAETLFTLARALWHTRQYRKDAVATARQALAGFAEAGKGSEASHTEVAQWLEAHSR